MIPEPVTHSALQGALETLYGLERRKDRLGLDGTRALLGALGNPERRFRAVHVAGTNGKGSTCALVERVLREAGARTGLFTSPHLVDFRERIRVNGRWADEGWLFRQLERIASLPEGRDRTFFEVATALGFLWFAEQGVEWAVVEVGLGGRLDTTNVITPEVSVITPIGLDHTEILGDSVGKIAAEKAGIIKPGVPVVSAETSSEAGTVIAAVAGARGAPLADAGRETPVTRVAGGVRADTRRWGVLELPTGMRLLGPANAACALGALGTLAAKGVRIDAAAVRAGFANVRWPGRLEPAPGDGRLWWDGAHNASGARALAEAWAGEGLGPPGAIVLAVSRDKDVAAMLDSLRPVGPATLVATRTRSERAREPAAVREAATGLGWRARAAPSVVDACREALAGGGRVLLTGSLFAVGEAMEAFGGAPGERL